MYAMDFTLHQNYASPVKRKVLGDIINTGDSPISPTANLKLLTKVASQYGFFENSIRSSDLQSLPANFYSINVKPETPPTAVEKERCAVFDDVLYSSSQQGKGRKFKSLGFLCDKFLTLYPLNVECNTNMRITLTDLANRLGVEKRRVYDIINVVESLQMATRIGKNAYAWNGHLKLVDMLSQLKSYAEQIGLTNYVRAQQIQRNLYLKLNGDELEQSKSSAFVQNSNIASFFKNERRIGILCQKFVMLFLVSLKDGLVNLELAANVLMSENCYQSKTRLRRLYDIANILVSLGVISRPDLSGDWKKPVFRYIGPSLDTLNALNIDGSLINKFKTEYSDENSSDLSLSEDSREPWRQQVIHCDHSYSMASTREPSAEPAVKKRLFFQSAGTANTAVSGTTGVPETAAEQEPAVEREKPSPTFLRVMDQGSLPQPITDGGVYKAQRVGNDIRLIRIDSA